MNSYKLKSGVSLRIPTPKDGAAVHRLIAQCPPLDTNSMYCNLLQCAHFADTSVAAEQPGELVGFVSGYLIPQRPDTLFIWQVAVSEQGRGQGLATQMLEHILNRPGCRDVTHLETSITESNRASWALFERWADKRHAGVSTSPLFCRDIHFAGGHDTEILLRIGPFHHTDYATDTGRGA